MTNRPCRRIPAAKHCKITGKALGWRALAAAFFLLTPAVACAEIAVTLPPFAGLIRMLDAKADVFCLLPAHADAHHVQLAPRRIERLMAAQWLIRSSRDDGAWHGLDHARHVLDLWPQQDHAWLDPQKVRLALPRLAKVLVQAAPQRREIILARLAEAERFCESVEEQLRNVLAPYRKAGIILQHPAWLRLLQRLDVPVLAVLEPAHHGQELKPHALDKALAILQRNPDVVLLGDVRRANRALNWLVQRVPGRQPLLLDAVGECGLSWLDLMQRNLAILQRP